MIQRTAEFSSVNPSRLAELETIIRTGLASFIAVGNALIEIRDKRLYRETHTTFEEYCRDRWDMSNRHVNRIIQATEFAEELGPTGPKPDSESHVRPILHLPKLDRVAAWKEAVSTAPNGKPTAKHVQSVVDKKKATTEGLDTIVSKHIPNSTNIQTDDAEEIDAWDAAISATAPAPKLEQEDVRPKTSVINGVAAADPPDVARLRAAGKIGSGVVVEVTEPDDEPEVEPEPEIDAASLSDDEWLATLPLSDELRNSALRTFQRDALVYRQLERPRAAYKHHAVRVLNADKRKQGASGEYAFRVSRFLRLDHPKNWTRCPSAEHGGCGGSGQIPPIGECPKCRGRGYWIA